MPGNSRVMVLSSSTFRKNWTFETIMPEAQATTRLLILSLSFLDLIRQLSNFPLRRLASAMKPPPYTPEKLVKLTWFARPLRANTLLHWSALVAHAPVSSNAFTCCGIDRPEPAAIAAARTSFRSAIIGFPLEPLSMTAEYQCLDRQEQCLDAQQQRMHQSDAVDDMQDDFPARAGLLRNDFLVVAGIGVDDAAAARSHTFETALIERLQKYKDGARSGDILRIDQLLPGSELSGGDVILHGRDDHRNDHPGFRDAGRFRDHPFLHDLGLDLAKACLQRLLAGALRDEHPRGPHQLIDHVTDTNKELLHTPIDTGANEGL